MSDAIPTHRSGTAARSGDTHVIGADGEAVNVDVAARDAAAELAAVTAVLDADGEPFNLPDGDVADPPAVISTGKRKPAAE